MDLEECILVRKCVFIYSKRRAHGVYLHGDEYGKQFLALIDLFEWRSDCEKTDVPVCMAGYVKRESERARTVR